MTPPEDEGTGLRERALRAAATAYSAAHGHPLEHPTAAGGVRWRTGTLALVAGAVVLACLVGHVAVRAVARPAPEPTLASHTLTTPGDGGPATGADGEPLGGDGGGAGAAGADERLVVHVVGAVHAPGLVRLAPGARVADAVDLAGGATVDADLSRLNLARPVHDGEQIRVPLPGEEVADVAGGRDSTASGPTRGSAAVASPTARRVDVNRATAAELEALPGIGPVLAERVVAHRAEHGPFASVDALTAVSGIGPRVLDGLRDHVAVGGA